MSANRKIAIFGGSFNPPGNHHVQIARRLAELFDEVVVVPCGRRPDKETTNFIEPVHRAAMVDLAFGSIPGVRVELFDLGRDRFMPTHELESEFDGRSEGEVWHVIGADLIAGGAEGVSPIQRGWEQGERLWSEGRFAVVRRPDLELRPGDLPPRSQVVDLDERGSSSEIRRLSFQHEPVAHLMPERAAEYRARYRLYEGGAPPRSTVLEVDQIRAEIIHDPKNEEAVEIAEGMRPLGSNEPNLIVVIGGDGTLLRTIREHWHRRLPFYGINAGHMGFLLNEQLAGREISTRLIVQHLPLLSVETIDPAGEVSHQLAFNDAWIERDSGQTAWIRVLVDGQVRLARMVADGALVATPSGSASYARAMGAHPIPLDTPALLLVGSNVLKPDFWKPVVLPLASEVEFRGLEIARRPLRGFIDGRLAGAVRSMRVRVSRTASVELAFDERFQPSEKLAKIQFPLPD